MLQCAHRPITATAVALGRRWASSATGLVTANGRKYALPIPGRPVVGICLDGSDQEYIDRALVCVCVCVCVCVFMLAHIQTFCGYASS